MIVMKFGGTSVESGDAIARLAAIVNSYLAQRPVLVVANRITAECGQLSGPSPGVQQTSKGGYSLEGSSAVLRPGMVDARHSDTLLSRAVTGRPDHYRLED